MKDRGVVISSSENELKALEAAPWAGSQDGQKEGDAPRCSPRTLPSPA
jgi:hypothetical protein